MWLNQLFGEGPVDFEKRCKLRIRVGIGAVVLGLLSIAAVFIGQNRTQVIEEMYIWFGIGLMAGGMVKIMRNRRYLNNPDLKRIREIMETDERNREIGLRCWAYSGYTMFLLLYIGILAGGFVNKTAVQILLAVTVVYALLLLVFRFLLQRRM